MLGLLNIILMKVSEISRKAKRKKEKKNGLMLTEEKRRLQERIALYTLNAIMPLN